MFLLRRSAVRAISVSHKTLLARPRSSNTFTQPAPALQQRQWTTSFLQRRFASDEATKGEAAQSVESEDFAQTAAEAPIEDGLTPAQQDAQADPTDAAATITSDALSEVESVAQNLKMNPGRAPSNRTNPPNNVLYIGNLFYEVSGDQLQRVFSRFGEVKSTRIVYDDRGLSRGFGYVEFEKVSDAQAAIDNLDMQVFEGRNLVVQFHRARSETRSVPERQFTESPPSTTLFLGNMSFQMSDKDLNDLFRDIRNVDDVRVAIDRRTGQPRGFAHADFIDVESAIKAKEILTGKVVHGRKLRVDFSKGNSRKPRNDTAANAGADGAVVENGDVTP